ncbi:protoporphyrinogen oxidase [[Actinobacillus] muris]|uniref:Protoporphyrinogen IX dehydrogenase [quinone] n=1 Tax=Muribacter muris TaxID=67855 RepID=A0A0J5P9S8_9PAST|nr:menaquinone-dependent protoporphyrinogen IX dehydrogenase [Muribacter muris]KMK52264.1 protoporphyrinogen oxidase [[Actinobacillus] muris] [Muribacter muris]
MKTLILYLTRDGQTRKIAEKMAQIIGNTTLISLREQPDLPEAHLSQFDQIIIGSSIRYGHFDPILERFIQQHFELLNAKRSAFFSVNLTARKANRSTPQTNTYTRKLLARIAWQPDLVEVFAGALLYPRYRWFDRMMIRFIMKITQGETDTRREYEYTDWQQVAQFAEKLRKVA